MIKNINNLEELLLNCLKTFGYNINFTANFSNIDGVDIQFNQLIQLHKKDNFSNTSFPM